MSTLKVNAIESTSGGGSAVKLDTINSTSAAVNLFHNGEMLIDQRVGETSSYGHVADRWAHRTNTSSVLSTTTSGVPAGFSKAASIVPASGTHNIVFVQGIELFPIGSPGQFTANTKWTISIWSTAALNIEVGFNSGRGWGTNQSIQASTAMTSTGNTSNSYTQYKHTIDIASVTPDASNAALSVRFTTTSAVASVKFTGAQFESGENVSAFSHVSAFDELQRCKRYYYTAANPAYDTDSDDKGRQTIAQGDVWQSGHSSGSLCYFSGPHPVEMRVQPTMYKTVGSGYFRVASPEGTSSTDDLELTHDHKTGFLIRIYANDTLTNGRATRLSCFNSAARLAFSAEL